LAQQALTAAPASAAQETVYVKPATVAVYMGFTTDGGTDFTLGGEFTVRKPAWKAFGAGAFFSYIFSNNGDFISEPPRTTSFPETILSWRRDLAGLSTARISCSVSGQGYEIARGALVIEPKTYFDFVYGTTAVGIRGRHRPIITAPER
jgi:hypothetical protein